MLKNPKENLKEELEELPMVEVSRNPEIITTTKKQPSQPPPSSSEDFHTTQLLTLSQSSSAQLVMLSELELSQTNKPASQEDSDTLNSMTSPLPRRLMMLLMEDILMEDLLDLIAPVRDPQDLKEASEEEEVDTEEVQEVATEEAKVASEEVVEHPETQETQQLTWARMTNSLRRVPWEPSKARRWPFES